MANLPTGDNDVLTPVDDRDRSVGMHDTQVPRVETSPAEGRLRRFRIAEILAATARVERKDILRNQ
jgi:hypothetical protein